MIQARPRHLFSWGFDLLLDDGSAICLDMAWFREGGRFAWDGTEYQISREGFYLGDFLLTADGQVLAAATKGLLSRRFSVRMGDRELELRAASWLSGRFELVEQGTVIGEVARDHFFTRSSTAQFPQDLSVPVQVFLFWLVILMWRRQSNAAASGE